MKYITLMTKTVVSMGANDHDVTKSCSNGNVI